MPGKLRPEGGAASEARERGVPSKRSSKCKDLEVFIRLICRTVSRGGSVTPAESVRRRAERENEVGTGRLGSGDRL